MTPSTQDARATGLVELAERVEAASGGDGRSMRTLGREVLLLCGRGYVSPLPPWNNPVLSIDAAVKLVPEGRWWSVDAGNRADVWASGHIDERWHATAAKPALALTAAALRARALAASTKDQNDDG